MKLEEKVLFLGLINGLTRESSDKRDIEPRLINDNELNATIQEYISKTWTEDTFKEFLIKLQNKLAKEVSKKLNKSNLH